MKSPRGFVNKNTCSRISTFAGAKYPHGLCAHRSTYLRSPQARILLHLPQIDTDTHFALPSTHIDTMVKQDFAASSMPGELVARVFMRKKSGEKQRASDEPRSPHQKMMSPPKKKREGRKKGRGEEGGAAARPSSGGLIFAWLGRCWCRPQMPS